MKNSTIFVNKKISSKQNLCTSRHKIKKININPMIHSRYWVDAALINFFFWRILFNLLVKKNEVLCQVLLFQTNWLQEMKGGIRILLLCFIKNWKMIFKNLTGQFFEFQVSTSFFAFQVTSCFLMKFIKTIFAISKAVSNCSFVLCFLIYHFFQFANV